MRLWLIGKSARQQATRFLVRVHQLFDSPVYGPTPVINDNRGEGKREEAMEHCVSWVFVWGIDRVYTPQNVDISVAL